MLRNVNVDFGTESLCIPRPIMSMGIRGVVHAAQIFPLVNMKSAEWKKSDVLFLMQISRWVDRMLISSIKWG